MSESPFLAPEPRPTIRRLPILLMLTLACHYPSFAQDPVEIELTPDDKVAVTFPYTGLDQEVESSTTLGTESWSTVNEQISFAENRYRVAVPINGERQFFRVRQIIPPTAEIFEIAPQDGAGGVAVTRETVIHFTSPLSEDTMVTEDNFYAQFGAEKLGTRSELSPDRKTLTLFYDEPLPGGAQISVFIDGNQLKDIAGRRIDADSDSNPGGIGILKFNTLSLAPVPGTAIEGNVYASEVSVDNGETIDVPLEGVMVVLDGKESEIFATTDSDGYFKLQPVPAGEFFVHVIGWTVEGSNYPDGNYYATVGKAWHAIAGKDDNLAGGTGKIYLPLIQGGSLQSVSSSRDTEVTFLDNIVSDYPELEGVSVTVPANALLSEDGSRGGMVGIAPVAPDRLPEPLPEGLAFPIVITVQSDGASNFASPAPVKFPNLPDPVSGETLPPGAKTALWAFNHDSGRWEVQGSMTISDDGKYAVSDPGVGLSAPGWVGVNPGSGGGGPAGGGGGPPHPPDDPSPPNDPDKPDRDDDDECTMEVICTVEVSEPNFALCLLNCTGNLYDRIFGDEEDKTPRSPVELGLCVGNALDCGQNNTMDDALNSDKYDDSLSSNQTDCMDDCLTPNTATYPAIVPCEGFVDPCPENLNFSDEELAFLKEQQVYYDIFDLEDEIQPDWIVEQKALWEAEANYFSLVFGTDKIAQTSPIELEFLRDFFNAMRDRLTEESEEGKALSANERSEVTALQRPSQFLEEEWNTLINRMELMASNTLPAEQWDEQAVQAAAQHVHDVTQLLIDRGWEKRADGLIYGMQRLSNHLAPPVGSDEFPAKDHYYYIRNFETGFERRGRLSSNGTLEGAIFSPNEYHMIAYLDPDTLKIGAATFFSDGPGGRFDVPTAPLSDAEDGDSDNDGLTDDVEKIVGTNSSNPDSDNDGVPDGAEVLAGTNPLDGTPVSQGILGAAESGRNLQLLTTIDDLIITGDADGIIRIFQAVNDVNPILLSQFDLPGTISSLSSSYNRLAIGGNQGTTIVNISIPTSPVITHTLPLGQVNSVLIAGPYLYSGTINQLVLNHVYTGEQLDSVSGFSPGINDLTFADGMLYSLASSTSVGGKSMLEKRPVGDTLGDPLYSLEILGSDHPTFGRTHIAAGGGYVYLGALDFSATFQVPGVAIVEDTGDAFNLVGPPEAITLFDVALDGFGDLLFTGGTAGLLGDQSLGVLDLSDPTKTDSINSLFDTPSSLYAVNSFNGYAAGVDFTEGVMIINYATPDFEVDPPGVVFVTDQEGATVEANSWVRATAAVTGESHIRKVEFYINDGLVVSDGAYPFEQYLQIARIVPNGDQVELKAKVYDLIGNVVTSDSISYQLVDTQPPAISGISITEGESYPAKTIYTLSVEFNEALESSTLNSDSLFLQEAGLDGLFDTGDEITLNGLVSYNLNNFSADLTFPDGLDRGQFQLVLGGTVSDLFGNVSNVSSTINFTVWDPEPWTVSPLEDSIAASGFTDSISVELNEDTDPALWTPDAFKLFEMGEDELGVTEDDLEIPGTIAFNPGSRTATLTLANPLEAGLYFGFVSETIVDAFGTSLKGNFRWPFEVRDPNTWIADGGGSWSTGTNWSNGAISPSDILVIDVPDQEVTTTVPGGTTSIITLDSKENLNFSEGTFNISSQAVVDGLFSWSGQATLDGGGLFLANSGVDISSAGANKWIRDLQMIVGGNSTWGGGSILFTNSTSLLEFTEGSTLEINNEDFVNLVDSSGFKNPPGVVNNGAITKKGPSEFRITDLPFVHNGTLEIQEGVFEVYGGGLQGPGTIVVRNGGTFSSYLGSIPSAMFSVIETPLQLDAGATLQLKSSYLVIADDAGVIGNGDIQLGTGNGSHTFGSTLETNADITAKSFSMFNSSTAILNGTTIVETLLLDNNDPGELGGTGIFEVTGEVTWNFGYMDGGGITRLRAPTTISQDFALGLGDRTVEIYDTFTADGGFMRIRSGSVTTLHVMPGGTFIHKDDFQFTQGGTWPSTFIINEGTYTKEGDVAITQNRVNIENRGTLNLDHAVLRVDFRFIQTADGTLNLPIRDAPNADSSHGNIAYVGAVLDGTLSIQLAEGFVPEIGASYRILAGGSNSITGTFANVTGLNIAEDREFEIEYENNRFVNLNVVEVTQ